MTTEKPIDSSSKNWKIYTEFAKERKIVLHHGDSLKFLRTLPDNSVDLILTDPPYPIDFIEEWSKLSEFAKKKLKPNGFCICYCGHKNLFESIFY